MQSERTRTGTVVLSEVRTWLLEMQVCVQAVDYERAKALFLPEVISFGTYSGVLNGLEDLAHNQWGRIWPNIREFTFRLSQLRTDATGDLAWAACPWDSLGQRDDGTTFARPGRMTVILVNRNQRWLAAHTHFSLYPPTHEE